MSFLLAVSDNAALMPERLPVNVTFDRRRAYVASGEGLPTLTALSLAGLRRQVDARLGKGARLLLDRAARFERNARRHGGEGSSSNSGNGERRRCQLCPAPDMPTCHKQTVWRLCPVDLDQLRRAIQVIPLLRLRQPSEAQMQGPYARLLRTILTALLMLAAALGTAIGGPLEDAVAAYKKADYATALQLFLPLADDGLEDAQYYLGYMYFFGEGVAQNYAEAVNWFRLAADQGRADAQYALGWMYFNGWGVTQDYILALMWFDLSATRGHQIAVSARDHAAKQMTPTQITEAQKRARDWKPKPHREIVDINIYPWSSIGKIGVTSATVANACSGTVIGSNEFLTAAHCLYNSMTKRFFPPDRYIFCLAIPEVNIACTELLRGTQSRQHSTLRSTAIGQTWKSY